MPRFLALLQYTTEGSKVLLKEKVTVRETFARKAIESVGGKVESIYFTASGEYHIAMLRNTQTPPRQRRLLL